MNAFFFSRLRVQLIFLVSAAMAPVLVFILYTGFEQREMAMEKSRQEAMKVARLAAANQENLIEGVHQLLITLSRLPEIQSGEKKACEKLLSDLLKKYPIYLNIGMTDSAGVIYISAIPIAKPVVASERTWFQRTRNTLDFSVGDYEIGYITHLGTLNFGYPLLDQSGSFKGTIYIALSLNWVNQLVTKAKLSPETTVEVIDSNGVILARNSQPEIWVGKNVQDHLVQEAIAVHRKEGCLETIGTDGIKRLYAFTLLKGGIGEGTAYVCVGIPSRLAFDHPIRVLRRNLMWLGIATLLAMIATCYFGDAFILKPVEALLLTTRRLAAGDMGARTGLKHSSGEIGELAMVFDQMVGALEKRVKERQLAEQALRQSEERSRRVFEDAATGMIIVSMTGSFWQVNQAFVDFIGYSENELEGMNVMEVTHPDDQEVSKMAMLALEQAQGASRLIIRYVRKSGEVRLGETSISLVTNSKGTPGYLVAQVLDVTDRVQAQLKLEQQHATLEQANRAKDEFIAMLSHELRTPLTPVLICIDSFQDAPNLPDDIQSAFSMIRRNIKLEARLIDDLLDVAKVTFGKVDLHLEVINAHALLRSTLEICNPAILAKKLVMHFEFEATHEILKVDPSRLQQVFWNLISNAVKFTPLGGSVTIRTMNPTPNEIIIEVTDTGDGIDPGIKARIFNPFEQGRRQFGGGLGLGLAIAKGIAEAHEGILSVRSEGSGCGSTFMLKLKTIEPLVIPEVIQDAKADLVQSGHSAQILLVEDHEDTRLMLSKLLTRHGYSVHSVNSMKSALDLDRSLEFNLLICDLGLPDGSGLDLIKQLKNIYPDLKGIAISGFGMDADIQKSKEAGFIIHLIKPVSVAKLESAIEQIECD